MSHDTLTASQTDILMEFSKFEVAAQWLMLIFARKKGQFFLTTAERGDNLIPRLETLLK